MSKESGLAAFSRKAATNKAEIAPPPVRERGKGNIVALTIRLSRADWERVHQLAVSEGRSIQVLAVEGLSKMFVEKGLPGLTK
ncbi:MAG: hypothetical protein PHP57_13690 [Sideroxydans sp.]|nr:hypothetical protein [Sideroxydans sp.]